MATINPYLNFPGNAEDAFNFYKSVFGGEFITLQRFKDTPEAGQVSEEDANKLMHISLPIGKGNILMATDAIGDMCGGLQSGNNFYLSLAPDSEDEANHLFDGLSNGGKISMPMSKMFWGAYFGMFTDKFGIHWMVNYDQNQSK